MNEEQFLKHAIFQFERLVEISEANTARQQSLLNELRRLHAEADKIAERIRQI